MAKEGKGRKVGRNKRKPSNVAYAAQDRLSKNKKLRAAREERKQAKKQKKLRERALHARQHVDIGVA